MAGLLDIAPAVETVDVRGTKVEVRGVSSTGIAHLLGRFPELRMLMSGKSVEMERLLEIGGGCVAAIIAAGIGFPGDADQEAVADRLSVDEQADLLAPILRLTMPKGVGPFVEKLTALGGVLGADPSSMAPALKSPKRSMNSSGRDTRAPTSGP